MSEEKSGEIEKADFMKSFEGLRPDLFFPEAWTKEQRNEALAEVTPTRTKTNLYASIPMSCRGRKCIYADTCPLLAKNLAPEGKPCPIEMAMVSQFTNALMDELNVSPSSMVEVAMVRDLVDQEVQTWRASKILAQEDMVKEIVVGVNADGEPIFGEDINKAIEIHERLLKRKKDLRNQLMATREKKAQVGQGQIDSAIALANIFHDMREVEQLHEENLKRKLGQVKEDEYIKADRASQEIIDAEVVDEGDDED